MQQIIDFWQDISDPPATRMEVMGKVLTYLMYIEKSLLENLDDILVDETKIGDQIVEIQSPVIPADDKYGPFLPHMIW